MSFSGFPFLLILLPVLVILHSLVPSLKAKNVFLLLLSLAFYAWGEPVFVLLLLFLVLLAYVCALLLERTQGPLRNIVFALAVLADIGVLLYFKYSNFLLEILANIANKPFEAKTLILPLGISFYLFQLISYQADVLTGKTEAEKNPLRLLLYASMFTNIMSGPIIRYPDFRKQLEEREVNAKNTADGLRRYVLGLFKKAVIANQLANVSDVLFNVSHEGFGTSLAWVAMISYSLQLYYDFSGYSDMSLGVSRALGFSFAENFNYPYIANSITDFWRRWHISLGSFFRDYVYIPLGGNRVAKWRWLLNILCVWALTGLWHGASMNFVVWGLFFGILLIVEKLVYLDLLEKLPRFVGMLYTLPLVMLGWIVFRSKTLEDALFLIGALFGKNGSNTINAFYNLAISGYWPYLLLGILLIFPIWRKIMDKADENAFTGIVLDILLFAMLAVSVIVMINSSFNPFIYANF